jgi:hypothetical protein
MNDIDADLAELAKWAGRAQDDPRPIDRMVALRVYHAFRQLQREVAALVKVELGF